jgi:DNA-directed RNA polymerase subunit D
MPAEGRSSWKTGLGDIMNIEINTLKPKKAVMTVHDAEVYLLNTLRRIMLSEVPKLAIQDVIIYDNTSALFDEIISHRLGLIPIPTDLGLLSFRQDCVCEGKGCPNCTVRYTLSKEGAGMVYSGDLVPAEKSWAITEKKIPIVELFNDQRLILEVETVLGIAKNHAKWQLVIAPGYRFMPTISFDPKRKDDVEDFISEIPKDLVTIKDNTLVLSDVTKLPVLESYIETERVDFITVSKDPQAIQFHFETDGSIPADETMLYALDIFKDKLDEFESLTKKL